MEGLYEEERENPLPLTKKEVNIIGITYNLRQEAQMGEPDDKYEEYDCLETVESLCTEVTRLGFQVFLFEQNEFLVQKLESVAPDFVLNIAEGLGNFRGRESQVPCILESLGIPFSGSDSTSLAIGLDKVLTTHVLRASNVPVPESYVVRSTEDLDKARQLFSVSKRCIVKPRWEGSSKGIFLDSVVNTPQKMEECIERVWKRYDQPAVVEAFLPGVEITAGVAGNSNPECIGMMTISPVNKTKTFLYSLEEKRNYLERIRYNGPETISANLRQKVAKLAVEAFKALELRDIARIDFRLDESGEPRVIDINPLPGLSPAYSDLPILYRLSGGEYTHLIKMLLREAFSRYNLSAACLKKQELQREKAL
ncbi:MAG: ATP-grasp domain-containing protein [Aminobacterium sp.]|jgi:D-alanine-D-alanine ligase|uniref:D-alanine--D-alanine ligase family protein n=1 Tax=Aminobacterium sp. TaxID=1872491 RepID=UPI002B220081|nr:ATP-grasp domain-containing protein [Aminobacterium sp.]MEA4877829.1 ATP-grasp domain-containing protein [Aminobacterium sp.]